MKTVMSEELSSEEFFAFNTVNRVSAYTDDPTVLADVVALCAHYEHLFSRTRPDSQLARINAAAGKPVVVEEELARFIEIALSYCEESKGLFDITMGGVVRLWDFKAGVIPDKHAIEDALAHVGYRTVHVDGNSVRLDDPQATLDLGGIAKGYIADGLSRLLVSRGVKSGIVNLGGNVLVIGEKPDGTAWNVGIRMPAPSSAQGAESVFATLAVRDSSVVTSGVYERAFSCGDELYHHILDPRTGFPAQTDIVSATIVSKASIDGDGYTTALVIMGLDEALAFVESRPNIEAVFVTTEGAIYGTSAIGEDIPLHVRPS